jgi:peptidyl-prolyl cis-trans isomerase D
MATLNTLRTRGALIVTIVIGVALVAFLLQDLTSASSVFQSGRNRVGSVGRNNIDYMEFVAEADRLEAVIQTMYGRSSLNAAEMDQINNMAWESFVRRYSYGPAIEKLGITVGEAEQIDMVQGTYTSPVIASLFGDPNTGAVDKTAVAGFVSMLDSDPTGGMSAMWDYAKSEMVNERSMAKFVALTRSGAFVNDLEVARGVSAANNAYNGKYASLPFTTIADSLVNVTSSEVRDYYRKHKDNFRQGASRDVEYVAFILEPSEADYAAAADHVAGLATEFAAAEDAMQYATLNSQERTDPAYYTAAQLTGDQLAIAFGDRRGEMAGPTLNGNVYTISKVGAQRMMPDSVGARHILLPAGSATVADSLVRAIRGGADIFALAPSYSIDQMVDLGRFPPDQMVEPFANAVIAAGASDVFSVDTQYGTHVVQMTYKGPQVTKAQIATVTYNVEPSAATEQVAYGKARDFLTAAAGSKEKFDEAVTSTGATPRVATIGAGDREVMGLADSRELVRWSFNTKPGVVSTIMEIDNNYIVAVVTGAKEAGIADVRDVAQTIASRLRTDKKTAMLTEQMAGKSVDEVAAMTGATSGDVTALYTNSFYDQTLGVEPAVIGVFQGLAVGATSRPVKGYSGVYVVSESSVEPAAADVAATDASEKVRMEAEAEGTLPQRLMQALADGSDIEDNRARFF